MRIENILEKSLFIDNYHKYVGLRFSFLVYMLPNIVKIKHEQFLSYFILLISPAPAEVNLYPLSVSLNIYYNNFSPLPPQEIETDFYG